MESVLTKQQFKSYGPRPISGYADGAAIYAHVRFDDECKNGHNTFAITGTVREPRRRDMAAGGCIHEEIAQAFPELAKFIKWHLCSTDGPMHYVANVCHLAGDRDCHGKRAGEPSLFEAAIQFGNFPIRWRSRDHAFMEWMRTAEGHDFEAIRIDHERDMKTFGPKWTLGGAPDKWYQCPFDTEAEAMEFLTAMRLGYKVMDVPTAFSEGKPRELDAARRAAIWPEATDAELCADDLKERLEARLPALLAEFRKDMEELGFTY